MAMWTATYIAYHLLLLLLSAGTTDFDGNPYGADDYTVVGLLFITLVIQIFLLPKLIKNISAKIVLALSFSAYLYWSGVAVAYGGDIGSWLVPTIYAAPLLLLYGGYCLAKTSARKKEVS
jgi:apolipoprotein N-acyltransferase